MKANQKIELTPEQRDEVDRKEARNKLIAIGVTVVTAIIAGVIDRKLEKKLIAEYTNDEEDILEEG